jgi:TadE-like protein
VKVVKNHIRNKNLAKHLRSEKGVSLWEFAIVFPVFFSVIMFIVDFGRVAGLQALMGEAMDRSMESAASIPNLDIDPRGLETNSNEYKRLKLARQKSSSVGVNWINNLGLIETTSHSDSMGVSTVNITTEVQFEGPRLLDLEYTSDNTPAKIAVLLPGECVRVVELDRLECNGETLGTGNVETTQQLSPQELLDRHPIKVVSFFQTDSFLPFLFNTPQRLVHYAYRQPVPASPFSEEEETNAGIVIEDDSPEALPPLGAAVEPEEDSSGWNCEAKTDLCVKESLATTPNRPRIPTNSQPTPDGSCECQTIGIDSFTGQSPQP